MGKNIAPQQTEQMDNHTALCVLADSLDVHCQNLAFLSGVVDCLAVASENGVFMTDEGWLGMAAFTQQVHKEAKGLYGKIPK